MLLVAEDTGCSQSCYGNDAISTPAIDGLAAEGVRYENAFSTAPVCAPSRSSLLMGKYAFSVGSHHMRSTLIDPPTLFTEELRKAGYYVNWSNKTDFNFEPPESFADDRHDWFEDLASGRLSSGRPWLLYHNFFVTHESSMWADNWESRVAPHLKPEERCPPDAVTVPAYLPDTLEVRTDIARHYDSLVVQDQGIARALDALEKSGEKDNTIVVYLSDHGRGLPREKRWCYEAGIHMPLIIRWPGRLEGGVTSDELVSWVDIAPTLLSALGIPVPESFQGNVFLGSPAREYCFAGRDRMDEAFDRVRAARDKRFLYIRNFFPEIPYAQRVTYMEKQKTMQELRDLWSERKLTPEQMLWMSPNKPEEELYDCIQDPDCVDNLAGKKDFAPDLKRMRVALNEFLESIDDKGVKSERNLIEQGLVLDRLDEYGARIEPLSEKHRIVAQATILEMPDRC